jgi:dolichol-phosphate mannosyltransferase
MIALSIVIPIYNEQETLPLLYERLNKEVDAIKKELGAQGLFKKDPEIEILFVNDGSTDDSPAILESIVKKNNLYRYVSLSRNFGHQAAVSAGMQLARGKAVVIMDGDLQDPPELIKELVQKRKQGFDVVYAVRRKRQAKFLKNVAYKMYYKIKTLMSDYPVQSDSGDFSLLDRKVVDVINKLPEKDRYMRGLRAWVGFKQASLAYDRPGRESGKSKYSFSGLLKLASQGIVSTSVKPLFVSGLLSLLSVLIIVGIILFAVFSKFYIPDNQMPKGWTSLMVTIAFLSGCQLISTWFLSLYVARLFKETLSRPTYVVEHDSLADIAQKTEE